MIRRHWLAVFHNPIGIGLFVAAVLSQMFLPNLLRKNWSGVHSVLHFFLQGDVRFAQASQVLSLAVAGMYFFSVLAVLAAVGWWYATAIILDEASLTVRTPFSTNSIPLQAIQDVQTAHRWLGLVFNYGTLVIYSGNETENIDYVPDVESFAQQLSHRKA